MVSVVSICNLALSNIGKNNISSLSEASAEARACNQFYEHVRDVFLQEYPWEVAGKTIALAELDNDKPGRWRHAYSLPTDYLKVRWIRPAYAADADPRFVRGPALDALGREIAVPYELEGQVLYCDLSPCLLRYTFRLADPTALTPMMVDALAWNLAIPLAMPLTRDGKIRGDTEQIARVASSRAAEIDASQTRDSADIISDFIAARGGC